MNTSTIACLIVCVILAIAVTILGYPLISGAGTPPASHSEVISSIDISVNGDWLEPECIDSRNIQWLSLVDVDFRTGSTYTQSCWVWRNSAGDVDYCSTVWGPDESGNVYYVEFARLNGNEIYIYHDDGTIHFATVSDWSTPRQEGYTVLKVIRD